MEVLVFPLLVISSLVLLGLLSVYRTHVRSAIDVVGDLEEEDLETLLSENRRSERELGSGKFRINDDLGRLGLFETAERKAYLRSKRSIPIFSAAAFVLGRSVLLGPQPFGIALSGVMGFCLGYLYVQRREKNLKNRYIKEIEYFLPIVMERVVMAVQAGLDIIAALQAILELESNFQDLEKRES